jgi:hypothetical protein
MQRRYRRWSAAVLLGFSGAAIIALGQGEARIDPLLPGPRQRGRPVETASGARPGSILETTVLAMGTVRTDWGSQDLRDAVAGAPDFSVAPKATPVIDPATSRVLRRQTDQLEPR